MLDDQARDELLQLRAVDRYRSELWQEIRTIGDELQRGLISLLFDSPLRSVTPQYGMF